VSFRQVSASGQALAEECPFCGRDRFYLSVATGQYQCKKCDAKGNVTTFLTWFHKQRLAATTDDDYRRLKDKRGLPLQVLKRHEIALDAGLGCWMVAFKNENGNVVNIQRYYPDKGKPNKYMLPELPLALYGFEKLVADKDKPVNVCEGPWDAMALDYSIGAQNRDKSVTVATPGTFAERWVEHFRGRRVRAFYDNDKGGQQHRERVRKLLGESGVAAELQLLTWPEGYPDGCDLNDLILREEFRGKSILGWLMEHSHKVTAEPKLVIQHGRRPAMEERPIDWPWPNHLRCGSYVSFSGRQGTFKSTIATDLAARYTTGRAMPMCDKVGLPPGHVLFLYAEDDRDMVENRFQWAGGDFAKWHAMPAVTRDGDPLNVLEHLREMEEVIREFGIRLVIIDGQNSVVGAPNISTDMLARHNVSNKLHRFAERLNVCLIGIRNEDREGRAMGPQSMGDIGRCVLRAVESERVTEPPSCKLIFEKVTGTARTNYPPIDYTVKDHGGSHAEIIWGESPASKDEESAKHGREVVKAWKAREAGR
jgi:hypothetical protein